MQFCGTWVWGDDGLSHSVKGTRDARLTGGGATAFVTAAVRGRSAVGVRDPSGVRAAVTLCRSEDRYPVCWRRRSDAYTRLPTSTVVGPWGHGKSEGGSRKKK